MDFLAQDRRKTLLWLLAGLVLAGVLAYAVVRDTAQFFVERQAIAIADIVVTLSKTARSVYAQDVVNKLKEDGTGASAEYLHQTGYVPIPAQFLKLLGRASAANTSDLFHYKPVSKWNIEPTQGINEDFLLWAWPQLEKQDQADPKSPIAWTPVWRIEEAGGKRVLRYLVADPVSNQACANCHNSYEGRPEVTAARERAGVPTGKQWKVNQLLGALSVTVPLERIEALAAQEIRRVLQWVAGILVASLAVILGISIVGARQRRRLALLSWQATHDTLTELTNRRGFESSLHRFWESAREENTPHAMLMIDLDGFKPINDTYGHQAGDEVLKLVAKELPKHIRASDVAARLGGDEFGVLLYGCPLNRAMEVGEAIRNGIKNAMVDWQGARIGVGASIGIAPITGKQDSPRAIVEAADAACYVAKKSGKNRVCSKDT